MAKAAEDPELFLSWVQSKDMTVTMDDISASFFDMGADGSFGREAANLDDITFETVLSDPVDTNRVPGFSISLFCYRKYTWTTTGWFGKKGDAGSAFDAVHAARRQFKTYAYLGPITCGL